jgi:hypothetical protein
MRNRTVAALTVLAAVLLPLVAGLAAAPARADPLGTISLTVTPAAAVTGGTVTVTGSCPQVAVPGKPGAFDWPPSTDLSGPFPIGAETLKLIDGSFTVIRRIAAPAGQSTVTTSCGGSAPFTVLPAPILTLDPNPAKVGTQVTATGTCPLIGDVIARRLPAVPTPIDLVLTAADGTPTPLGTLTQDPASGSLQAATFPLPADLPAGNYAATTSCRGSIAFVIARPPAPTVTPTPPAPRVRVPNLIGLTEQQAATTLGGDLTLRGPTGTTRIVRQDPLPGALVLRGSAVTVELAVPAQVAPAASSTPLVVGIAVLVLLLALLGAAIPRGRRHRRERRWADDVTTTLTPGSWALPPVPDAPIPSVDVRVDVRRRPERLQFEEAGHARN